MIEATTRFELVGPWVHRRAGCWTEWTPHATAIGWLADDVLIAGVVFDEHMPNLAISMHVALAEGRRFPRRAFAETFLYPFVQLGVRRVNGYVTGDNERALRFDLDLGFRIEGRMRKGCPNGADLYILGMLREECRFIRPPWTNVLERLHEPTPA